MTTASLDLGTWQRDLLNELRAIRQGVKSLAEREVKVERVTVLTQGRPVGFHCPACGSELEECTDAFCRYCRQDLRPLHNRFCGCGYSAIAHPHPNLEKRFCPACGQRTKPFRPSAS